jgi:hypothetical protein
MSSILSSLHHVELQRRSARSDRQGRQRRHERSTLAPGAAPSSVPAPWLGARINHALGRRRCRKLLRGCALVAIAIAQLD